MEPGLKKDRVRREEKGVRKRGEEESLKEKMCRGWSVGESMKEIE